MFGWRLPVQQEAELWADADAAQTAAVGVALFLQTHTALVIYTEQTFTLVNNFLCSPV